MNDGVASSGAFRTVRTSILLRLLGFLLDIPMILAFFLLSPWLLQLVFFRRRSVGSILQRFGFWSISLPTRERIWIHAASVGEVRAAMPLIDSLRSSRPGAEVVLSTMTTGARDLAEELLENEQVRLFPFDLSPCVHGVLAKLQPDMVVLIELEMWPNFLLACQARSIPVVIVNGRISRAGFRKFGYLGFLGRWMMQVPKQVCARGEEDAERFLALGVAPQRIRVTGELKHDALEEPAPLRCRREHDRAVDFSTDGFRWVAGCTHPGEEEQVFSAHRFLLNSGLESQLLVAPRHVERAESVLELARQQGFDAVLESQSNGLASTVIVIDRIGRLDAAYRISDAAFVGGSLVSRGGHNLLEPVVAGCATGHGPSVENFVEMVEILAKEEALKEVSDGLDLGCWLQKLAADQDLRHRSRATATRILRQIGGAASRNTQILKEILIGS
ncbi:MAG: glycosyltransferase N-terminal domain-containing protein [Planctomycetota bacterium]